MISRYVDFLMCARLINQPDPDPFDNTILAPLDESNALPDIIPLSPGRPHTVEQQSSTQGRSATQEGPSPDLSSEYVDAPLRRQVRKAKVIEMDTVCDLRSHVLQQWNTEYVENMRKDSIQKMNGKANTLAKINAQH